MRRRTKYLCQYLLCELSHYNVEMHLTRLVKILQKKFQATFTHPIWLLIDTTKTVNKYRNHYNNS